MEKRKILLHEQGTKKPRKEGNERRTVDDDHPVEDIETNIRARGESVRGRTIFEIARGGVCRRRD